MTLTLSELWDRIDNFIFLHWEVDPYGQPFFLCTIFHTVFYGFIDAAPQFLGKVNSYSQCWKSSSSPWYRPISCTVGRREDENWNQSQSYKRKGNSLVIFWCTDHSCIHLGPVQNLLLSQHNLMQQEHFELRGLCEHTEKDWEKCTREANDIFFQIHHFSGVA